ncbi:hypothetical protein HK096_002058 [Nowakowskiella sp. JEL0078]|nr:hypothetical protein HK096_002058 [Nowakowskiella sp. JEL0078]
MNESHANNFGWRLQLAKRHDELLLVSTPELATKWFRSGAHKVMMMDPKQEYAKGHKKLELGPGDKVNIWSDPELFLNKEADEDYDLMLVDNEDWYKSDEARDLLMHRVLLNASLPWKEFFSKKWTDTACPLHSIRSDIDEMYQQVEKWILELEDHPTLGSLESQTFRRMNEHYALITYEHINMLFRGSGRIIGDKVVIDNVNSTLKAGGLQYIRLIDEGKIGRFFNWRVLHLHTESAEHEITIKHVWGCNGEIVTVKDFEDKLGIGKREHSTYGYTGNQTVGLRLWNKFFSVEESDIPIHDQRARHIPGMFVAHSKAGKTIISMDTPVDNNGKNKYPASFPIALRGLMNGGWFSRAWTLQELSLSRDIWVAKENGKDRLGNELMDAMRVMSITDENFLLRNVILPPTTSVHTSLFKASYSFRNSRLFLVSAFPHRDPTLLMEGRDATYKVDKIYALANMCGLAIDVDYSNKNDVEKAWSELIQLNLFSQSRYWNIWPSGLTVSQKPGCSMLPDVGSEARVFWPTSKQIKICGFKDGKGLEIEGFQLKVQDLRLLAEVNISADVDNVEGMVREHTKKLKWDGLENTKQEFYSMAEYAQTLVSIKGGRFMVDRGNATWVSGSVKNGWFTGILHSEVKKLASNKLDWIVQYVENFDSYAVIVCDIVIKIDDDQWHKVGHGIVCSTSEQDFVDFCQVIS